MRGTPFKTTVVKITKSNNVSEHRNRGLWHVIQNGDPTCPVRECVIETLEGVHITSLGPSSPIALADAQWMCLLNNKATTIVQLHATLLKYFEAVKKSLKDKPEQVGVIDKIEGIIKTLSDIYG